MQIYLRKDPKKYQKRMKKWDEEEKKASLSNYCGQLCFGPSGNLWETLWNMS